MNVERLHIGMKVRHPQYGVGMVKSLSEKTAEIAFDDEQRTIAPASSDLQPAEPTATLSQLEMPLANLIRDTAHAMIEALLIALPAERHAALIEERQLLVQTVAAHFTLPADLALVSIADSQGLGSGGRMAMPREPGR